MDISAFLLWLVIWSNSLFAQGWHYDLTTNKMIPPPAVVVERTSSERPINPGGRSERQ